MVKTTSALVLAGGGVAGIAWETGVLLGVQDADPSLTERLLSESTTLIGTSAGSTVAAQLATGSTLDELFARQIDPRTAELLVTLDLEEFGATMMGLLAGATSPEEGRRRLGAMAVAADTPTTAARRAVIEARLTHQDWPSRPLLITAVDTSTGELRVFDASSGVGLVAAVAASCAVPGIWPPVEIQGRLYMDGGVRTSANADLAAGAEQVLILVPSAAESPLGVALPEEELSALTPARVLALFADQLAIEAMGANPLDPASRPAAARAGRALGQLHAAEIADFWV